MWTRMTFNAMTGNTDDHLRNHGFLRNRAGWRLSPAYDLNPDPKPFERRAHALPFLPGEHHPSLEVCIKIAPFFNIGKDQVNAGLQRVNNALDGWQAAASRNGLAENEIRRMADAFEHEGREKLALHCDSARKIADNMEP
jgi:serine/threonine-protein kinase HipA